MVHIVTKQGKSALCRQEPITFRRLFAVKLDLGQFKFLIRSTIIIDNDYFLVRALKDALDNSWFGSAPEKDPVPRSNTVESLNFGVVLIYAVTATKDELMRKGNKDSLADIAATKQRNMRIHSAKGGIRLAGIHPVFRHLLATAAEQPLGIQPMGKLGTHS